MIVINQQSEYSIPLVALYDKEWNFIALLNKWQLMDVRIQIAEQKLEGYSIEYSKDDGSHSINILPDGSVDKWDNDLFDKFESLKQARKLKDLQTR